MLGAFGVALTLGALTVALTMTPGDAAPTNKTAPKSKVPQGKTEGAARAQFAARMKALDAKGDWKTILQSGQQWQKSHPDDPTGYFAAARAAYMLGEIDVSIAAWEKLLAKDPASAQNGAGWLKTSRAVRRNYPNLKLKPFQFVQGDAAIEAVQWQRKGAALLAAKKYDEIEKTAATLQKSKAADAKGSPHLTLFFDGLYGSTTANVAAHQKRIAAWRAARPQSHLARLAEIQMWTGAAWRARGNGFSSTITPAMSAKMDAALAKGTQSLKNLPEAAYAASPLAVEVALDWAQLSGAGREFLDELFSVGTENFPDYLPFYRIRANQLLPRWFGEPGEWQAMAKQRADQIGGDNGDIFYARVIWSLSNFFGNLPEEGAFDYERARRGLEILHRRHPNSLSVSSARLELAYQSKDWKTARQLFIAPNGHVLDVSWQRWKDVAGQTDFAEQRMLLLGSTEK